MNIGIELSEIIGWLKSRNPFQISKTDFGGKIGHDVLLHHGTVIVSVNRSVNEFVWGYAPTIYALGVGPCLCSGNYQGREDTPGPSYRTKMRLGRKQHKWSGRESRERVDGIVGSVWAFCDSTAALQD